MPLFHECREVISPILPDDLIQFTPLFDGSIVVHHHQAPGVADHCDHIALLESGPEMVCEDSCDT
eukprot:7011427-Pyramimonas_sp.AAC.1